MERYQHYFVVLCIQDILYDIWGLAAKFLADFDCLIIAMDRNHSFVAIYRVLLRNPTKCIVHNLYITDIDSLLVKVSRVFLRSLVLFYPRPEITLGQRRPRS